MEKSELIIVTGNPLKFEELSLELSKYFNCKQGTIEGYHEIQGTPEEILNHKLEASYEKFKCPVLVDDTSFHIEKLGGFPGAYMKDFTIALGVKKMGELFEGSSAHVVSRIGIAYTKDDICVAEGIVRGTIVVGDSFDTRDPLNFDPVFKPEGNEKSFGYMTPDEKNLYSHRGFALQNLIKKLETRNK